MQAAYDHFCMEFLYEDVGIYDIDREIEFGRLLECICEQFSHFASRKFVHTSTLRSTTLQLLVV